MTLRIQRPSAALVPVFVAMRDAFVAAGENEWTAARDRLAHSDPYAYETVLNEWAAGRNVADGWVPATTVWIVDERGDVVGECSVRHYLTPRLREMGGHIGYAVHPAYRGRGIATFALQESLKIAAGLGIAQAMVSCAHTNIASIRVIQKCGGRRIEDSLLRRRRYLVPTPLAAGSNAALRDEPPPMDLVVRGARAADAEAACAVIRRSITDLCALDHGGSAEHIDRWLSNKTIENVRRWITESHVVVAQLLDEIVGVAAMRNDGKVTLNYVLRRVRFQGVSKALMSHLEDLAAELGIDTLTVETTQTALPFYEALGFEKTPDSYVLPLTGTTATVLRKSLAEHRRIVLRAATPADRPFVEEVYFATQRWIIEELFGWRGDDVERKKFAESYDMRNSRIISQQGRAVGWLSVRRAKDHLELEHLYLQLPAQGRGVGTKIVSDLIAEAQASRKEVRVSTAKINPARRLYERLGFRAVREDRYKVYLSWDCAEKRSG